MYLGSEVMDDVAFAFHAEQAKREVARCNDLEEMRKLCVKVLEMLAYQRVVTRQVINQAAKAEAKRVKEEAQRQLPQSEVKES